MSTQGTTDTALPDYAPVPPSAFGPAVNEQGYYVGRVERNLYWVTDGVYQAAFLTTTDGVVLFDAPPSIGHNLQRAIDEIAQADDVSNKVTYLVHTHHHADHGGASSIFGKDVVRIGHEETRRLLLRDDDPARPAPEETFSDRRTLEIGGERIELAWHGANHTPDNSVIHFPEHNALMMVDIVNVGWVPVYVVNLSDDIPGYLGMPATALTYPWKTLISGHLGRLGTREDVILHQQIHGGPRGQREDCPRHGRSDALLPEVRRGREHVGRRQGLPERGGRGDGRPRHREVHGRARGRGRVHPGRRVLADGVDASQPRIGLRCTHERRRGRRNEGRSSVSTEQRETLDAILRQAAFPADSDVNEQRRLLKELLSAQPLPADVTVTAAALGGVPTAEITVDGVEPRHVVLYFHGGVYVMGDAFLAADLASQVGRRTGAKVISVDYRLAPEHPYPAAVDDALAAYEALLHSGTAPSDIAFAGESAGGGLAIATLVNARDHGLPLPAAAFVMSPYADLTLAGTTMETRREVDPLLSFEALQARVPDYTAGQDAALGLISPVFADLSGLPPLIIQAGTHEVLLDDALRLARQAATADVEVTLDITPGVPHVFQAYHPILDEAAAALDRAGQLLSAHLADAEPSPG